MFEMMKNTKAIPELSKGLSTVLLKKFDIVGEEKRTAKDGSVTVIPEHIALTWITVDGDAKEIQRVKPSEKFNPVERLTAIIADIGSQLTVEGNNLVEQLDFLKSTPIKLIKTLDTFNADSGEKVEYSIFNFNEKALKAFNKLA